MTFEELAMAPDDALDEAKRAGRGRVVLAAEVGVESAWPRVEGDHRGEERAAISMA